MLIGTLTQNKMTVVEGWVGGKYRSRAPLKGDLCPEALDVLCTAVSVNSTAVLINSKESKEIIVSGSKTEGAMLLMLSSSFGVDYAPIRAASFNASRGDRLFTFSSARKRMSVLMVNGSKKKSGVSFTKGAAEVIVACSTRYTLSYSILFYSCILEILWKQIMKDDYNSLWANFFFFGTSAIFWSFPMLFL